MIRCELAATIRLWPDCRVAGKEQTIRLTGKAGMTGRIFRYGNCWVVGLTNQLLVQRLEFDLDQQAGERFP
jgi:hypothetical protein